MLAALTVITAVMASAQMTQSDWRFNIKADDGAGLNSSGFTTIGVAAISTDGYGADGTASDGQDVKLATSTPVTAKAVVGIFNSIAWSKDIKSNKIPDAYPGDMKIWDLRVTGLGSAATTTPIRLSFTTVSATVFPVSTLPVLNGTGQQVTAPANYWLKMVNNKGVAGAPANYDETRGLDWNLANGSIWKIPVPTVHSTTTPYFTLTLPTINVTAKTDQNIIDEGYAMQFIQTPEPSSLLALGTGLMGLGGFFTRRRKS